MNFNITELLGSFGYKQQIPYLDILLPVGLSFHTFQAMSYTIEVYRGHQKPEKHFGIYALYVMFYPQLVAGPIERPQHMLHQFHEKKYFDYDRVVQGLRIMLWGFFKKLVVADRISMYVDAVYSNAHYHSSISMIMATCFFIFQIYCDFSGYSDIAVGAAKVMGYDLMTNFRRPLLNSKSIQEFWQRWHISLMTWFRDYLYASLRGKKRKETKKGKAIFTRYLNILIVFAVSGLWHGASYNFIIWGLYNGLLSAFEIILNPLLGKIHKLLGVTSTFFRVCGTFLLITTGCIFFRAASLDDALYILKSIFTLKAGGIYKGEPPTNFGYTVFALAFLIVAEHIQEYYPKIKIINSPNVVVRYSAYFFLIMIILMVGVFNGGQFIYFQF
ncbi:MAG: MBOAT family O-acyltransferase [Panacibacter sp.]